MTKQSKKQAKSKAKAVKTAPVTDAAAPGGAAPDAGTPANIGGIAAELASQAPPVNPGVVQAEKEAADAALQSQSTDTDAENGTETRSRRVVFDPAVHEVDANGQPVMTEKGRYKKKKGVYGSGATRKVHVPGTPENEAVNLGAQTNAATAAMATDIKTQVLAAVISKEFILEPGERAAEIEALKQSLDRYAPDGVPIHPLVAYAAIVSVNVAKRFQQPETQTWWQKAKGKIAAKIAMWRYGKNAAHLNSGGDNDGQNNAGNTASKQP